MKPKWLVEHDVFDEDLGPLVAEIKRQGMEVEQIKYVPFESGTYDNFADDECVICYGSLNLIRQLQRQKPWIPGSFCNLPNFECSKYYAYYGKYLFNHNYQMMPLAELKRHAWVLFHQLGGHPGDPQFFVRPSSGFKTFTGQVIRKSTFGKDFSWFEEFASPDSLVVVAPSKPIDAEYRLVVANRKVIAACKYKRRCKGLSTRLELDLQPGAPEKVIEFAESIIENVEWQPDPIYVMDIAVGYFACDGVGLLELNSLSCSGFYACPVEPIVTAASELAIKEWEYVNGVLPQPERSNLDIKVEVWDRGDYVVTMGGRALGRVMTQSEAERTATWLKSAKDEIWAAMSLKETSLKQPNDTSVTNATQSLTERPT